MLTSRSLRRILLLLSVLMLLIGAGFYYSVLSDLPSVTELESRAVRPTTRILDREGRLLYEILDPDAGMQFSAPLENLPEACAQATLATEDRRFYLHPGVDPIAIGRAVWQNWRAGGEIVSGASTLTQQVARTHLLLPDERFDQSIRRKLREAWLALLIERHFTKDEILQIYLNQTYYGHFAFGIEAASQIFFAKPVEQLSRAECALLAGLVQYPAGYDPYADPDSAKVRQRTVLRLMVQAGFLSEEEADQVAAQPLIYRSRLFDIEAPHFVVYAQELLEESIGIERLSQGGLDIYTSLDLGLQRQAEQAVRHRLNQLNCRLEDGTPAPAGLYPQGRCADRGYVADRIDNGAAVVLDVNDGSILAMVGSPDYFDASIEGNVNAALSLRQPGSAIKPFTYAAVLDPRWAGTAGVEPLTPASILPDLPTAFPGGRGPKLGRDEEGGAYLPKNYDLRYHGPVSLREALASSYNIPAVLLLDRIGVETLQRLAQQAGIRSFSAKYGLALTLGGGEVSLLDLTSAYGIFPQAGRRLEPRALLRVVDRESGQNLMPITTYASQSETGVISAQSAYLVTHILADRAARIPAFGEGSALDLPFESAAKTGTTTDWRDNWTVGFSSERLVGVWVGNADNRPMTGITGIDGAGPIWADIMRDAHSAPPRPIQRPAGLVERAICAPSGLLPTPYCPQVRNEIFLTGTEPTLADDQFVPVTVDRRTGLRVANPVGQDETEERIYWNLGAEYARWAEEQGIRRPPPFQERGPTPISSDLPDAERLTIQEPINRSLYAIHPGVPRERQRIPVEGFVRGTGPWHALRLMVDGSVLAQEQNSETIAGWWNLEPGRHEFWIEGEPEADALTVRSTVVQVTVDEPGP